MNIKIFIIHLILTNTVLLFPQANLIQSIDFDSEQRVVYALTGFYDSSYAVRYKDGNSEIWNLSQIFNLPFYWIATGVDKQDNIWAYVNNKLYTYDGFAWGSLEIPGLPAGYKYADLAIDDKNLWLSNYESGVYNNTGVHRLKLADSTWTIFNSTNSGYPAYPANGTIFLKGDSTFIGTNKGLVMIYNDIASVVLDTSNSTLGTQAFYCFYIDSQENRWLGTYNFGLVKWINNSNFEIYNTSNSNLPNNFVNAIAEDREGNLWLATDGGFACLKNDSIISYSNLLSGSIASLAVDNLDRLWMGEVWTGNLYVFDGTNLLVITEVNNQQPGLFPHQLLLHQNYPNPFNPTTNIGFRIADFGFVSLKVYDILGNEIATLVNEELSPGEYEVEFNVGQTISLSSGVYTRGGYASGVYFYQLRSGEFIQTKKMILLR